MNTRVGSPVDGFGGYWRIYTGLDGMLSIGLINWVLFMYRGMYM